jgi:hypothetical protein
VQGPLVLVADCALAAERHPAAWRAALQRVSDLTRLEVRCGQFPPGISGWDGVELAPAIQVEETQAEPFARREVRLQVVMRRADLPGQPLPPPVPSGVRVAWNQLVAPR